MTSLRIRRGRLPRRAARSATARTGVRTVAWLAILLFVGTVAAQGPRFVPTYALVQEAEPIVLTLAPDVNAGWLETVGTLEDGPLSIAFVDRSERGIRLAFRLAAEEPTTIRSLLLGDAGGAFEEAPLGAITIVPAVATGDAPLRRRATARFGEGTVIHAWRLVNESAEPQVVSSLAFAPPDVVRPLIVARVTDPAEVGADRAAEDGPRDDLPTWANRLNRSLAERVPEGRHASAERVEAVLRDLLPTDALRDPDAMRVVLAPGATLDLALVSASFALELASVRVLGDPLLRGEDASGTPWIRSLSEPVRAGPWP